MGGVYVETRNSIHGIKLTTTATEVKLTGKKFIFILKYKARRND